MNKNNELFSLVRSLSKSEKRYFKLQASVFRENNLLIILFDILERQKVYDEKEVLNEFKKRKKSKQLSVVKNRLSTLILKSMRAYNVSRSVEHRLNVMFQNIYFLIEKKLWNQSEKEIRKVIQLATVHEKYFYLSEALDTLLSYYDLKDKPAIHIQKREILEKIQNTDKYLYMKDILFGAIEETGTVVRNQSGLKKIRSLISNDLFKYEKFAVTHRSKMNFFLARFFYFRAIGDVKATYDVARRLVLYLESQPEFIHENPVAYRTALNNYIVSQLDRKKFDDFFDSIEKMKSIASRFPKADNPVFAAAVQLRVYELLIDYYACTFKYQQGIGLIPEIERWLDHAEMRNEAGHEITLYSIVAKLFFVVSKYQDTIKWSNKILNQSSEFYAIAKDIHGFARIMDLLSHYEMRNMDLLEHRVRSAKRFLQKEGRHFKIEGEIILFFKNEVLKTTNEPQLKKAFKLLKERLVKLFRDPLERQFLFYFDITAWIESKLENKSFADVLREKSKGE